MLVTKPALQLPYHAVLTVRPCVTTGNSSCWGGGARQRGTQRRRTRPHVCLPGTLEVYCMPLQYDCMIYLLLRASVRAGRSLLAPADKSMCWSRDDRRHARRAFVVKLPRESPGLKMRPFVCSSSKPMSSCKVIVLQCSGSWWEIRPVSARWSGPVDID